MLEQEHHHIVFELNQYIGATFWVIANEEKVVVQVHEDGSYIEFDGNFIMLTTLASRRASSAEMENSNDGNGGAFFTSSKYHVSTIGSISVPGIPDNIFKV